jgi:phenylacetate-CoA ligase
MDRNRLLEEYNHAFIRLFKKAIVSSPFYKRYYGEHGISITDIKDITDIKKLPVIDRNIIKNHVNEIYTGFDLLKVKGLTSGTSGTPLTIYRTPFDIATEQAYLRHYRQMHGFKMGQPLLSIRGVLGKNSHHEFYKKANILYISSPNINENTIEEYHKMIKSFGPVAVEAFPSYLYKLCLELEKKGLDLNIPLTFTSSETLYDFQKEKIEPFINTNIFDWYGNVERSIGLAQDANKKYHPLPLYSINEFQEQHILTTALINKSFPLIRYVVEDHITLASNDFLDNIISPDIKQIVGRAGDTLDLKDGSSVGCIDHAFKGVSNLEIAQVHQYNVEEPIEFKLVTNGSFTKEDEDQLKSNLIRMLGEKTPIKFNYCNKEDLTFTANQKYRLIIKKKKT